MAHHSSRHGHPPRAQKGGWSEDCWFVDRLKVEVLAVKTINQSNPNKAKDQALQHTQTWKILKVRNN